MTYSAFGVDHGEISKMSAPKLPGAHRAAGPTKVGPPKLPGMGDAQKAIGQLKPMAGGVMAGLRGQKPGIPMSPSFNTGAKAGQAVRNNAKPLGAGAAVGAVGGGMAMKTPDKKKLTQYR